MITRLDELKAAQAASRLLTKAGGTDNYTKILKILYLADRESIKECGTALFGKMFVNMANGPLASDIYSMIREGDEHPTWARYIEQNGYDISLKENPGDDELSEFEEDLLDRLWQKYGHRKYGAMIDIVHKLPEWKNPGRGNCRTLYEADMLKGAVEDIDQETLASVLARNKNVRDVDDWIDLNEE